MMLDILLGKKNNYRESDWVVRGINFSADRGEVIGIIGVNGAGKSTLLKMICKNIEISSGEIIRNGKVSSILELGLGFHTDFTGRQNAILEAQINGMSSYDANNAISYIERFADIGDYFDKPVRIYSSGMVARLAFAIATANSPEILVVDEVLSVGDLSFQTKCIQKMRSLKDKGACILFVSHSLNQIREFCDKVLYISDGVQKSFGSVDEICDQYQNDLIGNKPNSFPSIASIDEISPNRSSNPNLRKFSVIEDCGTLELEFLDFKIMDSGLNIVSNISFNEKVLVRADIIANSDVCEGTAVGLLIADKSGYQLLSCNSNLYDKHLPALQKGQRISMIWEFKWPFQSGQFRIDIGMKPNPFGDHFYDRVFSASTLETYPQEMLASKNFGGYLFIEANVRSSKVYN